MLPAASEAPAESASRLLSISIQPARRWADRRLLRASLVHGFANAGLWHPASAGARNRWPAGEPPAPLTFQIAGQYTDMSLAVHVLLIPFDAEHLASQRWQVR